MIFILFPSIENNGCVITQHWYILVIRAHAANFTSTRLVSIVNTQRAVECFFFFVLFDRILWRVLRVCITRRKWRNTRAILIHACMNSAALSDWKNNKNARTSVFHGFITWGSGKWNEISPRSSATVFTPHSVVPHVCITSEFFSLYSLFIFCVFSALYENFDARLRQRNCVNTSNKGIEDDLHEIIGVERSFRNAQCRSLCMFVPCTAAA